ncbi:MAG: hypothetical protein ACTSQY_00665 [Candidatus Odinarchaeia archaeon]
MKVSKDFSMAKLRGSCEGSKIQLPQIQLPNFLVSGELMTFLGSESTQFRTMVNYLNEVLEEGVGRVSLVKMANVKLSDDDLVRMENRNIFFDEEEGLMLYPVANTLIAGSRILDERLFQTLEMSGFLDRFGVITWNYTKNEFNEQWRHVPRTKVYVDELMLFNTKLWNTHIQKIQEPPVDYVNRIKDSLSKYYQELEEESQVPYHLIKSARDNLNINHLMTAHAIANIFTRRGIGKVYKELKYEREDFIFAMNHMEQYARNRFLCIAESPRYKKSVDMWRTYTELRDQFGADAIVPIKDAINSVKEIHGGISERQARRIINEFNVKTWLIKKPSPSIDGKKGRRSNQIIFMR